MDLQVDQVALWSHSITFLPVIAFCKHSYPSNNAPFGTGSVFFNNCGWSVASGDGQQGAGRKLAGQMSTVCRFLHGGVISVVFICFYMILYVFMCFLFRWLETVCKRHQERNKKQKVWITTVLHDDMCMHAYISIHFIVYISAR